MDGQQTDATAQQLKEREINQRLPPIPHSFNGNDDCPGCLGVLLDGEQARIVCNECEAVLKTVPIAEVEEALRGFRAFGDVCTSEKCPHCGELNVFPGWRTMFAFVCQHCGQGVALETPVQ